MSIYGKKAAILGSLGKVAEYGVVSAAAGYVLGRYPERMRFHNIPTLPLVGVAAKAAAIAVGGKYSRYLNVLGNAWIAIYAATLATSYGYQKSGQTRAVLSSGDVGKLKAAVPGATILGVAEKAPVGRVLSISDIENIARGR